MSDSDVTAVNLVACEACRAKKCKCDRNLPSCGQCKKSATQCTYPQSFKRGFPEGYLSGLEHRLAETERALFNSLQLLRGMPEPDSRHVEQVFNAKRTKSTRTKEWERLPLTTQQERWQWFDEKVRDLGLHQQPESAALAGTQSVYLGGTPAYGAYHAASLGPASDMYWHGQSQKQTLSSGSVTGGGSDVSQRLDQTRADTRSPLPTAAPTSWQSTAEIAQRPLESSPQAMAEADRARLLSERLSRRFF